MALFTPQQAAKVQGQHLLHRRNALAEAGLVACGSIPVQRALLNRLIERGYGLAISLLGGLLVALLNCLAQSAQRGAQTGGVGAIRGRALRSLTGALKRRKMICHIASNPLCV